MKLSYTEWLAAAKTKDCMKSRFAYQQGEKPVDFVYDAERRARLGKK